MARPRSLVPSYRLHRASGQAVVTLSGEDVYLGQHRSDESHRRFDEEVAAWIARCRLPRKHAPSEHTVDDLILAYIEHTRLRFAAMGRRVEQELEALKYACRPLRAVCGTSLAASFDLQKAKSVRRALITGGLSLSVVNRRMGYIQRMFRWGASEGIVPPAVLAELLALSRLKPGESAAPIGARVQPVPQTHVAATIPFLPPVLRAMVELQWITGMRSGEVCQMTTAMLDWREQTWVYQPVERKTKWRNWNPQIILPAICAGLLSPYLNAAEPDLPLFSPRIARDERNALKRARRRTRVQPSQMNRTKTACIRLLRDRYDSRSYFAAIRHAQRAAIRAGRLPPDALWHPHQLRHACAQRIANTPGQGLDGARAYLGHAKIETTAYYANRDLKRAIEIAGSIASGLGGLASACVTGNRGGTRE